MTDLGVSAMLHLELELENCSGEVCLNDVPVLTRPVRVKRSANSVPVHPLLAPGANGLDLWVDIAGPPSACRSPRRARPADSAGARARLVRYPPGVLAKPEYGTVLAAVAWSAERDAGDASPRHLGASADIGPAFGSWSWLSAPVLALDDATRAEAHDAIAAVHHALRSADADRYLELLRVRFGDALRAYPARSAQADVEGVRAWMREIAGMHDAVPALAPEAWDLRLVADGRMIECVERDFRTCVRVAQEAEGLGRIEAPHRMFLARIDGRVRVAR